MNPNNSVVLQIYGSPRALWALAMTELGDKFISLFSTAQVVGCSR
jgi:hypothetical protein